MRALAEVARWRDATEREAGRQRELAQAQRLADEQQAILWADQLERLYADHEFANHNPCTKVHNLIRELIKFK